MYLDKRLNVGSLSSPSHMLWQTILRYWIAKILQAMLKEVRERRGEERKGDVKQMLLDCSKFHGVGWKAQYDMSKSSALLAVSLAPSGIISRLV